MISKKKKQNKVYKLKLINDNLKRSQIEILKQDDTQNLFKLESAANSLDSGNFRSELDENNEEMFYLQLNEPGLVDLDKVFKLNNQSSLYTIKLTAHLTDSADISTSVQVRFRLIDSNDNSPILVSKQADSSLVAIVDDLQAFVSRSLKPNTAITFKQDVRFTDLDFSPEFGIESVHFKVNDTRFQVNNQLISSHLQNKLSSDNTIPFMLNKLTSSHDDEEPAGGEAGNVIWIEVTAEDNYFSRRSNRVGHNVKKFIVKLSILDDNTVTFISGNKGDVVSDFRNIPKNARKNLTVRRNWNSALGK